MGYRKDTLEAARAAVKRNDGALGVDGVSNERMAATPESEAAFLLGIQASLWKKTYQAKAVLRVYIPKPNGKQRPLDTPTVWDRVVQAAVLLILEPIFEADFEECSYGFGPERSAHDALRAILRHPRGGKLAVYDGDLARYFDSIPSARKTPRRPPCGGCRDWMGFVPLPDFRLDTNNHDTRPQTKREAKLGSGTAEMSPRK